MSAERPPTLAAPRAAWAARTGRAGSTRARALAVVLAVISLALLVAEVASGWHVLHSEAFFTALAAKHYVWANAAGVGLIVACAAFAPARWRVLAILGPGAYLAAVLIATAIPGGQLLAMVCAILLMGALWDTGERLLRLLGADRLSRIAVVAWLAGIGPWSLAIVALGRISLVKWWTVGILFLVVGVVGVWRLAVRTMAHRNAVWDAVRASPLALVCCGVSLLTLGWAAIYTAAPEIQYDALYGKAFLPELWARTGHISTILQHVQDSITGWFQVLAVTGHLFDATAVGRYMQLLGLMFAVTAAWWWGHRHGVLGPLAAVAVALTPHLFWQASTADDDLLLAVAAFAFCIAIVESLKSETPRHANGVAFALGLMAGSGPSLKLHLTPLFGLLLLGWIVSGRSSRTAAHRFWYALGGAIITAIPPLALRWIDSGDPVLPAYNNIFRSRYWLPVNETLNFPFWVHPGTFGPLLAVWKAVVEPSAMVEDAPPGAFGLLVGAVVVAILFGWRGRERSIRVVWLSLIPALVFWWVSFRYLRYLLPICFVSVALVLMLTRGITLGSRGRALALAGVAVLAIVSFPVAISQFWNIPTHKPPVYAAVGHWSEESYLSDEFSERPTILAYNRLSPPHARMISDAFERVWLRPERDLYNLHYEVVPLMELQGIPPTDGARAFTDLRRLGIEWAQVTAADRHLYQPGYLSELLRDYGRPEFSERGWDLYRLVRNPPRPVAASACDEVAGVGACWGIAPTSALGVSVTRTVPACSGETFALTVKQAAAGPPAAILFRFAGGSSTNGIQPGEALPGGTERIYATAPAGATAAAVTISPTGGARITAASLGVIGTRCRAGL